jgi:tetratricopeptide (TPR) repeat protein
MARNTKNRRRPVARRARVSSSKPSVLKTKGMGGATAARRAKKEIVDPALQQQLKLYEEAVQAFHQQKYAKAKVALEKVIAGPGKELSDRGRMHLRVTEQRLARQPAASPRSTEDHYQQGVAMMNLGRWDDAREHLLKARKMTPKADFVFYAMAALDCLTGEAESAMENLKVAISLRPENRYHARNDEDFAFLQEDPRFTELLYPEREGSGG